MATSAWGCGASDGEALSIPESRSGYATADMAGSGVESGSASSPSIGGADDRRAAGDGTPADQEDGPTPTGCQTDDACAGVVEAGPCQAVVCDLTSGLCTVVIRADGSPCGDEDLCLNAGACGQGLCIGQDVTCDDGNPCTDDSCESAVGCVYAPNTASCDDGDGCTSGDACTDGACVGTPSTTEPDCEEAACSDGTCAADETCATCPSDCGACNTDPCAATEVEDCAGGCTASVEIGDGICDAALNCALFDMDGGDCLSTGPCEAGQMQDCFGDCKPSTQFGDGTCDSTFNCIALNCDDSDCECVMDCPDTEVENCLGQCIGALDVVALGDGACDPGFNCYGYAYDAGDCSTGTGCAPGQFVCSSGATCLPAFKVCDGTLDCPSGEDEQDCVGSTVCAQDEVSGCVSDSCYDASWLGDGMCDFFLECAENNWDGSDCDASGSCASGQLQCADGSCKGAASQCDGIPDCATGEDELGCP